MNPERPILSNRDYPYHDYESIDDTEEPVNYIVGTNNVTTDGDQKKRFISKSTLIYSDVACTVRFNHTENVTVAINAGIYFTFECDIRSVYVLTIAAGGTLQMWFEGVLPDEARSAQ